jgi:hypothetical protein
MRLSAPIVFICTTACGNGGDKAMTRTDGTEELGLFTKNDSTMPIRSVFALWNKSNNKLKIYMTPSPLSNEDKAKLEKGGSDDILVFLKKDTPDNTKWQNWYPYVAAEFSFKSNVVSSENVTHISTVAYGIDRANSTSNISSSYPNEGYVINHIKYDSGVVSIDYSGNKVMGRNSYSWRVKQ